MISKSFFKSSIIYTIGGALPLASGFVLLPFYLNFLSTSDFGVFALYFAFTYFVQIVMNFGFEAYIGVHYFKYKDDPKALREYIGTIISSLLFIGIILTAILTLTGIPLFQLVFKDEISFYPYGFMCVLTAFFNSFFRTYSNLLINQQKPGRFFWSNVFNFSLTIIFSIGGLYLYPHTLVGPMWGRLLSGIAIFILSFLFLTTEYGIVFKSRFLKPFLRFCFPVLIYFLLSWVISNLDRFIINGYMNTADVGIFDFAVKCTLLIDFFQNGLTYAINPKIYGAWKEQNINYSTPDVNRYFNGFTAVSLLVIPAFVCAMPILIPYVTGKVEYYQSFLFFNILCLGFVYRGMFNMFSMPLFYFNKTWALPKVYVISSVLQVASTFYLVKYFGLMGAVWASFLIKPVQALLLFFESKKVFQFKFNTFKIFAMPLLYSAAAIATTMIPNQENLFYYEIVLFVLTTLFVTMIYRKEIQMTLQQFLASKKAG